MRLICPNCDAQYDVADDAIPPGGRDVQCSSCAHTWYQTEKPVGSARSGSMVLSRPLPDTVKSKPVEGTNSGGGYDTPTNAAIKEHKQPNHRPIDPTVANILREEAAFDQKEAAKVVDDTPPPTSEAVTRHPKIDTDETLKRIAEMTEIEGGTRAGTGQAAAVAAAAAANPRAIPDINEINAALRARAEASDDSGLTELEHMEAARRRSFRFGFFGILLILALAVVPYVFSEDIMENLPQTRETLATYVVKVDELRIWLADFVGTVRTSISSVTG